MSEVMWGEVRGSRGRECLRGVGGAGNWLLHLSWLLLLDWLVRLLRLLLSSSTTAFSSAGFSSTSRTLLLLELWLMRSLLHGADFLRLVLGLFPFAAFLLPGDHHSSPHFLNFLQILQRINLAVLLGQVTHWGGDFRKEEEGLKVIRQRNLHLG